jgi:hypothetical protein
MLFLHGHVSEALFASFGRQLIESGADLIKIIYCRFQEFFFLRQL